MWVVIVPVLIVWAFLVWEMQARLERRVAVNHRED